MNKFLIINMQTGEFLANIQYVSWTTDAQNAVQFTQEENAQEFARLIYRDYHHIKELAIQHIEVKIQFREGGQTVTPPWVGKYVLEIDTPGERVLYYSTWGNTSFVEDARLFTTEIEALNKAALIKDDMVSKFGATITVVAVDAVNARTKEK